jgi:two-component sensor histidine kinase
VEISAEAENEHLVVRVTDNGRGLEGADSESWSETLGFTLIRNLVENQLSGQWSMKSFDGVTHELRFRMDDGYDLPPESDEEATA